MCICECHDGNNAVHIQLWYNAKATGRIEDYVYLGQSVDSSNDIPPAPTPRYESLGYSKGTHPVQIRIDEIPALDADKIGPNEWKNIGIRNAFACEIMPKKA